MDEFTKETIRQGAFARLKSRRNLPPQERIFRCALREFSQHGYAGARMERIARQAKLSKRMIFYYFGSKQHLFEVVVDLVWQNGELLQTAPVGPVESLVFWSTFYLKNPESTRLLSWEGLEWKKGAFSRAKERRAFWQRAVGIMKTSVGPGGWPPELDSAYLLFGIIAMEMAPVLLPNLASLILDQETHRPDFQRRWVAFMRSFAQVLVESGVARNRAAAG